MWTSGLSYVDHLPFGGKGEPATPKGLGLATHVLDMVKLLIYCIFHH
jgi:hypothetical protein